MAIHDRYDNLLMKQVPYGLQYISFSALVKLAKYNDIYIVHVSSINFQLFYLQHNFKLRQEALWVFGHREQTKDRCKVMFYQSFSDSSNQGLKQIFSQSYAQ